MQSKDDAFNFIIPVYEMQTVVIPKKMETLSYSVVASNLLHFSHLSSHWQMVYYYFSNDIIKILLHCY